MRDEEKAIVEEMAQEIERRWPEVLTEVITDQDKKGFLREEDLDAIIEVYQVSRDDLESLREFASRSTIKLLKDHNLFIAVIPHDKEATQKFYSKKVSEVLMVRERQKERYS